MASSSRNSDHVQLLRVGLLAFCVAAVGNALGWWQLHHVVEHLPTLCVLRAFTGHDCPGCGMGRALALLTHGEVVASLRQHPFGLPLLIWVTFSALVPDRLRARICEIRLLRSNVLPATILAALVMWWALTKVV